MFGRFLFPVPWRTEGWVGLSGWCLDVTASPQMVNYLSTNWAQHRVSSFDVNNAVTVKPWWHTETEPLFNVGQHFTRSVLHTFEVSFVSSIRSKFKVTGGNVYNLFLFSLNMKLGKPVPALCLKSQPGLETVKTCHTARCITFAWK